MVFPMTTDYTKSPDEILVQLINDENGRNFSITDLDLLNIAIAPDPVSGRESYNNSRTSIGVFAADGSGYKGNVGITYNRVPVRDVFGTTDDISVRYPNSEDGYKLQDRVNLVDLIPEINSRHAINLQPSDVFDIALPTFDGPPPYDPKYARLEIAGLHKVFFGGINIRVLPNDWDLNNMQYTELNGLVYPNDQPPSPVPQAWTDIANQFSLLGTNGGWNYTTKDPGDGTTPPSSQALAAFAAIDNQFQVLGTNGGWNYQPH